MYPRVAVSLAVIYYWEFVGKMSAIVASSSYPALVHEPQLLDSKPLSVDLIVRMLFNPPRLLASICFNSPLKPDSLAQ